jgi:hypothetical protein
MSADPNTFDIGLVMAGAVSAGAYTAGVIDMLTEALDAYDRAKDDPAWTGPRHDVRIAGVSGASAGGITAALAAIYWYQPFAHVGEALDGRDRNALYRSWVSSIDISHLLAPDDLMGQGAPRALLNGRIIDRIANEALTAADRAPIARRWLADPLPLWQTVTNLDGVPYGFEVFANTAVRYAMYNHADPVAFAVSPTGRALDASRFVPLDRRTIDTDSWRFFAEAAVATGAFPIGLPARVMRRLLPAGSVPIGNRDARPIEQDRPLDRSFLAVDGGTIDNEPLELLRSHLALEEPDGRNPRDGETARKAVLLIDPFPNQFDWPAVRDPALVPTLLDVARALPDALKNQARFRPQDLSLAKDDAVFSRFMIAPSRRTQAGGIANNAIASGILGGFGGFLSEAFRRHDYQLGRRNAWGFLKGHFALPVGNKVFEGREPADPEAWYVRDRDRNVRRFAVDRSRRAQDAAYPIIPLVGHLQAPFEIPAHDHFLSDEIAWPHLETLIDQRMTHLQHRFARVIAPDDTLLGFGKRAYVNFGLSMARRGAAARVVQTLKDAVAAIEV